MPAEINLFGLPIVDGGRLRQRVEMVVLKSLLRHLQILLRHAEMRAVRHKHRLVLLARTFIHVTAISLIWAWSNCLPL